MQSLYVTLPQSDDTRLKRFLFYFISSARLEKQRDVDEQLQTSLEASIRLRF